MKRLLLTVVLCSSLCGCYEPRLVTTNKPPARRIKVTCIDQHGRSEEAWTTSTGSGSVHKIVFKSINGGPVTVLVKE